MKTQYSEWYTVSSLVGGIDEHAASLAEKLQLFFTATNAFEKLNNMLAIENEIKFFVQKSGIPRLVRMLLYDSYNRYGIHPADVMYRTALRNQFSASIYMLGRFLITYSFSFEQMKHHLQLHCDEQVPKSLLTETNRSVKWIEYYLKSYDRINLVRKFLVSYYDGEQMIRDSVVNTRTPGSVSG